MANEMQSIQVLADASRNMLFGLHIQQSWLDLLAWDRFLLQYNSTFNRLLELGTGTGTMTLFLLLEAANYGFDVRSLDIAERVKDSPLARKLELGQHCCAENCFSNDSIAAITDWATREGNCVLFCDNGDKPRELATFGHVLKHGDYLAVHDWGTEVTPANAPLMAGERYQPLKVLPAELEPHCLTRFWRIT